MLKTLLKSILPLSTRQRIRRLANRCRHLGTSHACPTCRAALATFLPWSGAENFLCPVCRSKPPHRLATLAFERHPEWFAHPGVLLHVAPEVEVAKKLRGIADARGLTYRAGGITGHGAEYLDLLALPMADHGVSFIYCCHVLNCMQDDRGAMREIHRVLHPRGVALLQVPAYWTGRDTLETNSRDERLRAFQDDGIYRCYTDADYIRRLQESDFDVECFRAADLPPDIVRKYQLKAEVLHICRKRGVKP